VRKIGALIAAGVVALAVTTMSLGAAKTTVWTAALSSGQEVPAQTVRDTAAHGLFKATLVSGTLHWKLTFAKLTGPATAAHIHMGLRGQAPPNNIVQALCGPCTNGQTGSFAMTADLLALFKKHKLYVNVHTAKNPAGEIRGQLARG
jgi:hypothetical protein